MKLLAKLDSLLVRIFHPILIVVGLSVALMLVVGILTRTFLGAPLFGLEEIMLLGVMWFYMLGAALASRERSHLSGDFMKVLTKNHVVWRAASIASTLISLAAGVLFVIWSYDLFAWGVQRGQATPVFSIPWVVSQSSLFFASILFVAYLLRDLIHELTDTDRELFPKEDIEWESIE